MLITVDVGNSGLKAGVFEGAELLSTARIGREPSGDLASLLGVSPAEVEATVAVSVNRPLLDEFLQGTGRGALVLGRDLESPVVNRYRRPEEVGADRLVNAAAGHARVRGAAVVVDLGSAVTVDVVSKDGEFLGGAIGPGLPSLAAGLAEAAPALPSWDGRSPGAGVPRSTREAIRRGLVAGLVGITERLVREMEVAAGHEAGSLPLVLTGGDAGLVGPRLDREALTVPHLTLDGVRLLYERARGA